MPHRRNFRPPPRLFRLTSNKAFTLIELLVVVLIIGILAAVALPQYTRTVDKARTAEAFLNLKTLKDSMERYYLETGSYTNNLEDLDIEISDTKDWLFRISPGVSVFATNPAEAETNRILISYRLDHTKSPNLARIICRSTNSYGDILCKSLGATEYTQINPPRKDWIIEK